MKRTVLSAFLILGLAGIASAQMNITGYVYPEVMPIEIDSVYFEHGAVQQWFRTPGWNANPQETTSFTFPEFAGWPAIIKMVFNAGGMPGFDSIYRPQPDSWYQLRPPNEQIHFKFHGELGIQEHRPAAISGILPGIISWHQLSLLSAPNLEIVNHMGQHVNSLNLAPGIYFYRQAGTQVYNRVLLVR